MIRLDNISYAYFRGENVIDQVSIDLPSHSRMAVLGGPESGKTTLIGLLSGVIDPTRGRIERFAHLSFPAGYNRAFRFANTVRQNLAFAAQLYGADPAEVVDFVCGIIDLNGRIDRPMRELPVGMRPVVAFALTYALPFDTYLFDNIIGPGDPATRDLWRQLFEARTAAAGAIVATRQPRVAEAYCDCALVLRRDSPPVFFENLREAIALFEDDAAAQRQQPGEEQNQAVSDAQSPNDDSFDTQTVARAAE